MIPMNHQKILVMEDQPKERVSLCKALEDWGCYLDCAFDSAAAVAKVRSSGYCLIIASVEIPGFCGLQFLETMRALSETVRVVFLTARASVEDAVNWMKAGAYDVLLKPLDLEQMKYLTQRVFEELNAEMSAPENPYGQNLIITRDVHMKQILELAARVADSRASVLIQGESGTGKEMIARFIHENSLRRDRPFVAINCGALPESLLESELFGYEKGAFTGAAASKKGKFEAADGGTLLLDEITEMQFHLQAKLLRALQEREIDRVGGLHPVKVDVRVVATTNRDIHQSIKKGEFREDLYYRLNVIPIKLPPLRERSTDIFTLASHFVEKYNKIDGRNVKGLTREAIDLLERLPFPGNVRELENIIERALLLCSGDMIHQKDLFLEAPSVEYPPEMPNPHSGDDILKPGPLREVEKNLIFHTLDKTNGNRTHAAKILGISIRTLRNKLNEYKDEMEKI